MANLPDNRSPERLRKPEGSREKIKRTVTSPSKSGKNDPMQYVPIGSYPSSNAMALVAHNGTGNDSSHAVAHKWPEKKYLFGLYHQLHQRLRDRPRRPLPPTPPYMHDFER